MPVHVVCSTYDFWYEIAKADDRLEPGEEPDLNDEGVTYYLLYKNQKGPPWWPDAYGGMSLEEAMQRAEAALPSAVVWSNAP